MLMMNAKEVECLLVGCPKSEQDKRERNRKKKQSLDRKVSNVQCINELSMVGSPCLDPSHQNTFRQLVFLLHCQGQLRSAPQA